MYLLWLCDHLCKIINVPIHLFLYVFIHSNNQSSSWFSVFKDMGGSHFQIFPSSLPFFSLTCQSKMSLPSSELPSPLPLKTFLSKVGHPHLSPISPFQECLPEWVGWPIYCISIFLVLLTFTPKFQCYMRSLRRAKSWQFRTSEETQREKIKESMSLFLPKCIILSPKFFGLVDCSALDEENGHLCNKLRRKISILTQFRICLPQET